MRLVFNVLLFVLLFLVVPPAWSDSIFYPGSGRITARGTIDDSPGATFTAHAFYHTEIHGEGRSLVLDFAGIDSPGSNCSSVFLVPFISIDPQSFLFGGECAVGTYVMGVRGNFNGTGYFVVRPYFPGPLTRGTITSVEYTAPESSSLVLLMVGLVGPIAFGRRAGYRLLSSSNER